MHVPAGHAPDEFRISSDQAFGMWQVMCNKASITMHAPSDNTLTLPMYKHF